MPATLRVGSRDKLAVKRLQVLLNLRLRPSANLVVNGDFDKKTLVAVQRFQTQEKIKPTGVVGWRTWPALEGRTAGTAPLAKAGRVAPLPDTHRLSQESKFDYYLRCIGQAVGNTSHARIDLRAGRKVILGIRQVTNTLANKRRGFYDDRLVILWQDKKGKHVVELVANTEPSARYEDGYRKKGEGNDANGDGLKDLGRIPEGVYGFRKDSSKTYGRILRPTQDIIAERDTNHDGFFDDDDEVTDKDALNSKESMLFHGGFRKSTGAAGCQTMASPIFNQFWRALGGQSEFQYVLMHTDRCPFVTCPAHLAPVPPELRQPSRLPGMR